MTCLKKSPYAVFKSETAALGFGAAAVGVKAENELNGSLKPVMT